MDREGPEDRMPGQVGGEQSPPQSLPDKEPPADSVAAETSARVGAVLGEAEAEANAVEDAAERESTAREDAARAEAQGITQGAHGAAEAEARKRAERLAELRASIAARAGSLTEGLEGGELTRLRLEQLVAVLGETERQLLAEVGLPPATAEEGIGSPAASAADGAAGDGHDGDFPPGAPMMRMPARSGDAREDARFAAVLMAIQGDERDDVARQLRDEYGHAKWDELLDELFGSADVRA
jgi:hypothetical protein